MSVKSNGKVWDLEFAEREAENFMAYIKGEFGCDLGRMEICGSVRRRVPEVHDIDILAVNEERKGTIVRLATHSGIPVDIYYTSEESWGAFQLFLTGSGEYNIMMRAKAKAKGFKLSQYGLFKRDTNELIASKTEEEIYRALKLDYRDPEDRSRKFGDGL